MRFFIKTKYLIFILLIFLFSTKEVFAKEDKILYSKQNISNYLSGIVLLSQNKIEDSFKYLDKVNLLEDKHDTFNVQYIRTLVLLGKFDKAIDFSKSVWKKENFYFEADLLIGLDYFIKEDYVSAEKYFSRLNKISKYNLIFDDFFGNIFISWIKAIEGNKNDSFEFLDAVPEHFDNLKLIQESFLECYFDSDKTPDAFEKLIDRNGSNFSRYDFFLLNYYLSKKKIEVGKKLINEKIKFDDPNILIKQSKIFFNNKKYKKITNYFNCKDPKDVIAEIFYVISNLYSSEKLYKLSNFYLNLSFFLNDKFSPNKKLLAENLFFQKRYNESKKIYNSIKSIGSIYSWYASKSIASVSLITHDKEYSVSKLKKAFGKLPSHNFEHYYELANFYKDNELFEDAIKYYSLALENIEQSHYLVSKILDRRGTSFERLGKWTQAEKDLKESLKISPDQPYVLNYLAYSWIEKRINIDESFTMLNKAVSLKQNDPYITDSLGWAYFIKGNYINAEKFLQRAVKLLPLDPIVNDHYGDALWMLNRKIQARYFWNYVLSLDNAEQKLKDVITKKLIFGVPKKL